MEEIFDYEKYNSITIEELEKLVNEHYSKWILNTTENHNIFSFMKTALINYGVEDINALNQGTFNSIRLKLVCELIAIKNRIQYDETINDDFRTEYDEKMNKILKSVIDAENTILNAFFLKNSMTSSYIGGDEGPSELQMLRYSSIEVAKNKPVQNLILFIIECLVRSGYKRYKGDCYRIEYTPAGHNTHFWTKACTIKDFIYINADLDRNYAMWMNSTNSGSTVNDTIKYLENFINPKFSEIKRDRHVFAFNNGIYITCKWSDSIPDCVGKYKPGVHGSHAFTSGYIDEFIPYTDNKKISSNLNACNYFKIDFDVDTLMTDDINNRYNDWYNIIIDKCTHFKKIMDEQKWEEAVQRWLCICLGRMLYDVGELDEWQVMPFLLGQAGTGKSTILTKICKLFYQDCDIGTLSNNIEHKFGLSALVDKLMFIGPEIKENFSLEQSEFQSIISGEDVQINIKNKLAESKKWSVPGAVAGNVVPQFNDNAGSISRRLLVFLFNNRVKEGDTQLGKKLKKEVGHIIHACNRAYLDAVNRHGSSDIWNIVPAYFKDSRDDMAETTNALVSFIKSDKVILNPDLYITQSLFIDEFNAFCKERNFPKIKWSNQYTMGPFQTFNLSVKQGKKKYPNTEEGQPLSGKFIFGIDLNYNKFAEVQ